MIAPVEKRGQTLQLVKTKLFTHTFKYKKNLMFYSPMCCFHTDSHSLLVTNTVQIHVQPSRTRTRKCLSQFIY